MQIMLHQCVSNLSHGPVMPSRNLQVDLVMIYNRNGRKRQTGFPAFVQLLLFCCVI